MQSYGEFVQKRYDRFPEVRFVDLLIRIAEGQKGERDELLEQTLAAHIKAIKDLL